jgi:hypothetical protein
VSRLSALLPGLDRQPMLAGAAALALGYIGCSGQLPDLEPAATTDAAATSEAVALDNTVLVRIARLLPTTIGVGQQESGQMTAAAVARAATALGLGCMGERREEVLRAAVKALLGLSQATKSEEVRGVAGAFGLCGWL